MPLSSLDIMFSYTHIATGPNNNTLSLGGSINMTGTPAQPYTIPSGVANNVFDVVTGDESQTGKTEYRAIAIYISTIYSGGSFDAISPKLWISGYYRSPTNADTISIAASTFSLNRNTMGWCTGTVETGAPTESVTWIREDNPATIYWNVPGNPTTVDPGSYGTLRSRSWIGVWLRRQVPAGAAAWNNRSVTITFQCESTASPYKHIVERSLVYNWSSGVVSVV